MCDVFWQELERQKKAAALESFSTPGKIAKKQRLRQTTPPDLGRIPENGSATPARRNLFDAATQPGEARAANGACHRC